MQYRNMAHLLRHVLVAAALWLAAGPVHATDLEAWARRFAPVLRQDTASEQDYLTAFDFDGNWLGDDNWENQPAYPAEAVVYWAAVETETHAYLTYGFFHPRDYSVVNTSLTAHENDLEGALLAVEKSPDGPRLVALETIFHHQFLRVVVPDGYSVQDPDREGLRFEGERPVLAIEARGHGVETWDGAEFPGGDGVVYRPGAPGEPGEVPSGVDDRDVRYRMVPIETSLWAHRHAIGPDQTFGKAQVFSGETFGYAFAGTDYGDNKANAPWGWVAEGLTRGLFFLDPATVIAEHHVVAEDFATEYAPNPFTASAEARWARALWARYQLDRRLAGAPER